MYPTPHVARIEDQTKLMQFFILYICAHMAERRVLSVLPAGDT